jgi:NAD-dependent DNA ligase
MRSGDVIPYIVEVLTPAASGAPAMPDVAYTWSKSGVDIIVKQGEEGNDDMKLKTLEYFFNKLDIKGVSTGTITKIFNAGFQDVNSIVKITVSDLLKIDGFQAKSAEKIYNALQEGIKDVDCVTLMDASNTLGRGMGSKKIVLIVDAFPTILSKKYIPTVEELIALKGIEKKTAETFIQNLPAFFKFYDTCGVKCGKATVEEAAPVSNKYAGMIFVFTGFRSKELEDHITSNGGTVSGTINKKTTALIVKDKEGKESSKVQKVKEIEEKNNVKIKVVTKDEFMVAF